MHVLCFAPLVDELMSGVPALGAPDIRSSFDLGYGSLAVAVLSLPLLLGLFVESPLLLLAKRVGRRRMAFFGFLGMALAAFAGAFTTSAWQLAIALSIAATAGGVALGLAEASLMDAAPDRRELWMTRFTLGAALGDLSAPALMAVVAVVGWGWRAAFVVVGVMVLVAAFVVPARMSSSDVDDEDRVPIRAALRRALRTKKLMAWTLAVVVCDLLDEIVIVMAALFLRDVRGADAATSALALAVFPAAAVIGLFVSERLLQRLPPMRLLALCCAACAIALVLFVAVASLGVSIAMLGLIGLCAAPMWPLATAQTYRALPEDSTTVAAVANLFAPLGVAMPFLIAVAADAWGLEIAFSLLLLQPICLLAMSQIRCASHEETTVGKGTTDD